MFISNNISSLLTILSTASQPVRVGTDPCLSWLKYPCFSFQYQSGYYTHIIIPSRVFCGCNTYIKSRRRDNGHCGVNKTVNCRRMDLSATKRQSCHAHQTWGSENHLSTPPPKGFIKRGIRQAQEISGLRLL